jgi:hypothetical protein
MRLAVALPKELLVKFFGIWTPKEGLWKPCVVEFVLRPHSCNDNRIGHGQTIICASNTNCARAAQLTRQ